ncbi:MAG TPA: SsrA-binding protein SmpB [Candidatus Acidoferrales bacterium]|nr:SsrA-binding protein SmpB [Candidatus Acidoferrales bacterium]
MPKPPKKQEKKVEEVLVAQNRAASYNYHLLERLEAGMVLLGTEVKSLRESKANLRDAYGLIRKGEVWLVNFHIGEYLPGGPFNHGPLRTRKLLLRKEQIAKLERKLDDKGLTLIPLRIYFRDGIAKCEIALAQGKKKWDRRQTEKDKESKREVGEAMRKFSRR